MKIEKMQYKLLILLFIGFVSCSGEFDSEYESIVDVKLGDTLFVTGSGINGKFYESTSSLHRRNGVMLKLEFTNEDTLAVIPKRVGEALLVFEYTISEEYQLPPVPPLYLVTPITRTKKIKSEKYIIITE